MQEEIKTLKKQLRETKALCKTLEREKLSLSKEVEVLRKEKGYISDIYDFSEDMLMIEIDRHQCALQKIRIEKRRIQEQKRQETLHILLPMFEKAMALEKEGNILEAIKAHESCIEFAYEHTDILNVSDYAKSFERIAIIYRKEKLLEKEIAFVKTVLKTKKKNEYYSRSHPYHRLEDRLITAERMLARKK